MDEDFINNLLKNVRKNIESHGWYVLAVHGNEDSNFAYTIGLMESFNHPEIILSGLNIKFMQDLLNDLGEFIKKGQTFKAGQLFNRLIKDAPVKFIEITSSQVSEYLRFAEVFYEDKQVIALQCLWPDENGLFPTDVGCSNSAVTQQKLLG